MSYSVLLDPQPPPLIASPAQQQLGSARDAAQVPNLESQNIKYVESSNSSCIFSEHSFVLDRPLKCEEWDVMEIFAQLDARKTGVLSASNCAIESVTLQIRYILNSVLEEILCSNLTYNLEQFVTRVEQYLETAREERGKSGKKRRQEAVKNNRQ
jgi:hypothetical protein